MVGILFYIPGGASGGGGGRASITSKSQAPGELNHALDSLNPNCYKQLVITEDGLKAKDKDLQYFDGRPSEDGNVLIAPLLGPTISVQPNTTFNSVSYGDYADTLSYVSGAISPYVVLGTNFWRQTSQHQDITLVHEALHYALQKSDLSLARKFANYTGRSISGASKAFNDWLTKGCK